jgi:hypothetical protein
MNEEFDKRLTSHIKTVFDSTDNTGADAGWLLLREKYPDKENPKPVAWFWWLAALLLIGGLGLGLWQVEKTGRDKGIKTIGKAHNDSAVERRLPQRVNSKPANEGKSPANKNLVVAPVKKERSSSAVTASALPHVQKPHLYKSHKYTQKPVKQPGKKTTVLSKNENESLANHTTQVNGVNAAPTIGIDSNAISNLNISALADGISKFLIDRISLELRELAVDKFKAVKSDTSAQKTNFPKNKQLTWGVFASTFYSSAAGSDNEFNLGAGGTVGIRLAGHFGFSSGLGIMRVTLNYNKPPGSNGGLYATSTLPVTLPPVLGFHNYTAKLLTLDIPINLKYSFAKPYNFISAGLSSNVYISEYYDQVNTYSPLQSGLPDVHQVTQHHFDRVDLFKTFNFSFGLGYPVSNKSILIFEPFLKAPLSGLGSQKLKYASAGLNFKLGFQ